MTKLSDKDRRTAQNMVNAIVAVRVAQLVAIGYLIWDVVGGDWSGGAIMLVVVLLLGMALPRRDPGLERRLRDSGEHGSK